MPRETRIGLCNNKSVVVLSITGNSTCCPSPQGEEELAELGIAHEGREWKEFKLLVSQKNDCIHSPVGSASLFLRQLSCLRRFSRKQSWGKDRQTPWEVEMWR